MKLRCGVIGLGVGEQHARVYGERPECELVGICDQNGKKLAEVGDRFPGIPCYEDAGEMIRRGNLDFVSIASYDNAHAEQAIAALGAGCHVFVEKPLCQTEKEIEGILEALEGSRKMLLTNLILREAPAFLQLKQWREKGQFGNIYSFDGDYLYGRLQKLTDGWRGEIPFYSVMQGGGVHMVDLMCWILGERPRAVHSVGNQIASSGSRFSFSDFVAATFQFPSGCIGRISANFGSVIRHQHAVRVYGEKRTFQSDAKGVRVFTDREGGELDVAALSNLPPSKGALLDRFLTMILAQEYEEWQKEWDEHLATMKICLAANRALRSGEAVILNL